MNDQTFLQFIFNGYASCFHKSFWHTSSNYSDITSADLNFFSNLGQSLGFRVRREMTWHYPRDLCWCETNELKSDANTTLYLERENENGRVDHTIDKMLNPNNASSIPYLVALFGWITDEKLKSAKAKISGGLLSNQHFLLISWVGETKDGNDWRLEGWCLSGEKATTREFKVDLDRNGHWYAVVDPNNKWGVTSRADSALKLGVLGDAKTIA